MPNSFTDVRSIPGLKEKEILTLPPCSLCGRPPCAGNQPMFYRVRVESIVLDLSALRRRAGLEMMMGSPVLAHVLGPDDDLAKIAVATTHTVCLSCLPKASLGGIITADG